MGRESPLTRIPGAWADRHPVLSAALICAALAALVIAIASTAHAQNAATTSGVAPNAIVTGPSNILSVCSLVIGSPTVLTIDTCKRTITAAPDIKTDDAARQVFDALRPYLAVMSRGP